MTTSNPASNFRVDFSTSGSPRIEINTSVTCRGGVPFAFEAIAGETTRH